MRSIFLKATCILPVRFRTASPQNINIFSPNKRSQACNAENSHRGCDVERHIGEASGVIRTLRAALQDRAKMTATANHALLSRTVTHMRLGHNRGFTQWYQKNAAGRATLFTGVHRFGQCC